MAVESENVEKLMEWLAQGSQVRSANTAAGPLTEKLAVLLFLGDQDWPNYADRADRYRDVLREWFATDSSKEAQFVELTAPSADPGIFVDWFLPVVVEWELSAQQEETGQHQEDGSILGYENPSFDRTPGTEYYRYDDAAGEYLYADRANADDWATYEKRRYTERATDENYGLDYRYDRTDLVYEWFDKAQGMWNDQTWADLYAARRRADVTPTPDAVTAAATAPDENPEWDENWAMFYRIGPGGVYEFADAVTPGESASGCSDVWLSNEQVLQRRARAARGEQEAQPADPRDPDSTEPAEAAETADAGTQRGLILQQIPEIQTLVPEFATLTDDQIAQAVDIFLDALEGA